jgi:hypothetical protein
MASADITLPGSSSQEIVVDATQHKATLRRQGGSLINVDAVDAIVNVEAATINSTTKGSLDPGSMVIKAGSPPVKLPLTCSSFTFKATGGTSIIYTPDGGA